MLFSEFLYSWLSQVKRAEAEADDSCFVNFTVVLMVSVTANNQPVHTGN